MDMFAMELSKAVEQLAVEKGMKTKALIRQALELYKGDRTR
ncbi:hypothetical protein [Anaerophilus nitritogenes]|nr:hypothetical protein [Anaerophilus nitritogenes]